MPPGLGFSAFARHYSRNHCCFLFLRVLRCFSSPGRSPCGSPAFSRGGCPIRTPADQGSFAPPRSFSQLTASFVIAGSQGIPHAPFSCFLLFRRPPPRGGAPPGAIPAPALPFVLAFLSRPVNELSAGLARTAPGPSAPPSGGPVGLGHAARQLKPAPESNRHRPGPAFAGHALARGRPRPSPLAPAPWRIRDSNP